MSSVLNNAEGAPRKSGQKTRKDFVHSKSHVCTLCPNQFATPVDFLEHMRTHADERSLACKYCNKAFGRKSNRTTHEKKFCKKRPGRKTYD
jgi:uncharacterized Zn-finger protein